ncbi:MAG TPA: MFS transporter [Vicinamibacteria bacterium]|nr:MFS transporter [Vicinamibacteria bacterium]
MRGILEKLGLHRPELRAWAMYDWANSAFWATVVQIFPVYYINVAAADLPRAAASARYAAATTIAMAIVALVSPALGAIADYAAMKKRMLGIFLAIGVTATALMFFIYRGDWQLASVLFIFGNIGVAGSIVFYDSLLPHVAREDEVDRVSTAGYALGYLGSGLLMAVNLLSIQKPALFGLPDKGTATRVAFLSVAVWWLVFSIPLFRRVAEPPRALERGEAGRNLVAIGFTRIGHTLRELRGYRQAFLLLVAFLIYNDGIGTIIRMAAPYGAEMGLPDGALIGSLLLVQFIGIPFAFLFGMVAGRIGAKRALFIALAVYVAITIAAYFMRTIGHFFILCVLVGMVMGGAQALSRSLFSTMIPRHKSSEFFGFFGVFEKFAGIFGPGLFAVIITATGSSRSAILSLIPFFVVGAGLLALVDVEAGQRAAREAESRASQVPA